MLETAANPENIEFVSYHDHDDVSPYEYIGNHKEIIGPRIGPSSANECQKIASGPIYMFIGDDILFETYGWDTKVEAAFDAVPDKIALVFFNEEGAKDPQFACIGCLHKNWIDTVGYLFKSDIIRSGDRWINDIAHHLNRKVYLNDVHIKNTDIRDVTRSEYVARAHASGHAEYYKTLKKTRNQDIELLRRFIKNFKSGV
jgi:hypothetical protein